MTHGAGNLRLILCATFFYREAGHTVGRGVILHAQPHSHLCTEPALFFTVREVRPKLRIQGPCLSVGSRGLTRVVKFEFSKKDRNESPRFFRRGEVNRKVTIDSVPPVTFLTVFSTFY